MKQMLMTLALCANPAAYDGKIHDTSPPKYDVA